MEIMIQLAPALIRAKLVYCTSDWVGTPSIVLLPAPATVIVPVPLFLMEKTCPVGATAGRLTVKVPDVQLIW